MWSVTHSAAVVPPARPVNGISGVRPSNAVRSWWTYGAPVCVPTPHVLELLTCLTMLLEISRAPGGGGEGVGLFGLLYLPVRLGCTWEFGLLIRALSACETPESDLLEIGMMALVYPPRRDLGVASGRSRV